MPGQASTSNVRPICLQPRLDSKAQPLGLSRSHTMYRRVRNAQRAGHKTVSLEFVEERSWRDHDAFETTIFQGQLRPFLPGDQDVVAPGNREVQGTLPRGQIVAEPTFFDGTVRTAYGTFNNLLQPEAFPNRHGVIDAVDEAVKCHPVFRNEAVKECLSALR